ncbi:MAG: hypothetical protein RL272_1177, partial [Candidatus Parcubacteria bacterium]
STDFNVAGGTAAGTATAGTKGTVYVKNTATNDVTIYHGFTFVNTTYFAHDWTFDSTATNVYCDSSMAGTAMPSIDASNNLSLAGTLACAPSISAFVFSAGGTLSVANGYSFSSNAATSLAAGTTFSMGTGDTFTQNQAGSNLTFNVPDGGSQTWDSLTVNVAAQGFFVLPNRFALTLQNGTAINASTRWSALTSLTQNSGTTISANARGCTGGTAWGWIPSASNVCTQYSGAGYTYSGGGANTAGSGGGHGGTGGNGGPAGSGTGGATYGSATAPSLFGASGGGVNASNAGGTGGGVIRIVVSGTFIHNGTITANGGSGVPDTGSRATGGGSGGSIYVTAGTYNCSTGTFGAAGGAGGSSTANGGGGAGGRFSVEYGTDASGACPLSGLTAAGVAPGGAAGGGTATAGGTGTINLTNPVPTPGACPITDGGVGDDDGLANGTVTISTAKTFATQATPYDCTATPFNITGTGTLTLDSNTTTTGTYAAVDFSTLTIASGGLLTADGKGCAGSGNYSMYPTAANVCSTTVSTYGIGSGGGGHGGAGGAGSIAAGGPTYGSASNPLFFGSSGGGTNAGTFGANGGGVIKVTVSGTLTLNGTISANGNNGVVAGANATGGGAGGSINISAGTINGTTGLIRAKGGNGGVSSEKGGGGGGGRIAVSYSASGSSFVFSSSNLDVFGGTATSTGVAGTKGTVYLSDDKGTKNSTADDDVTIHHGYTFFDSDVAVRSWTVDSTASNQNCDPSISAGATPSISATTISLDGVLNCAPSVSTLGFHAGGALSLANGTSLTVRAALSLSAGASFAMGTGVTVTQNKTDADIDFDIPNGNDQTWSGLTVNGPAEGDFTVDDAIAITLASSTALNANVVFSNLTSFTENLGTSISADAKGCAGGGNYSIYPTAANVCSTTVSTYGTGAGGGGHGGNGGAGTNAAGGYTHDSATAPILYGASGGGTNAGTNGSNGGGLVRINAAGNVTLNGTVTANGANGVTAAVTNATGGGAGGSIYISATGSLAGSVASILAKGGNGAVGSSQKSGGGGGGRISLVYGSTSLSLAAGLFDVSGGTATSAAVAGTKGTVYVDDTANSPNSSADDTIRIYHGFTFADTDFTVAAWNVDASATNQYCDINLAGSATPSVSSNTISLNGTMNCATAITSLAYLSDTTLALAAGASTAVNGAQTLSARTTLTVGNGSTIASSGNLALSASGSFVMGSSVTVTDSTVNTDVTFTIPAGNDQTWSGLTVNTPPEGDFVVASPIALTFSSGTTVNGNVLFSNLTAFTENVGTSILANGKGCAGGINYSMYPTASNVCSTLVGTYGAGTSGGGHGGQGGAGTSNAGATPYAYGSATAPVLYGSSGGGGNSSPTGASGGGLVRINSTGTITLNGTVAANGLNGTAAGANATGGGAGGSVYVSTVGNLAGSISSIAAKGGDGAVGSTHRGGGGGGGRISLVYGSTTLPLAAGLFDVSGGAATSAAVAGTGGTVYADEIGANQTAINDDVIRIYRGFTYADYDYVVTSWIIDPTAVQSCDPTMGGGATPSVTATNAITFNGSLNCAPAITSFAWSSPGGFATAASTSMVINGALTMTTTAALSVGNSSVITSSGSLSLSAGTSFSVGTGVTVTDNTTNTNIDFNIPAGNDQTWSGLTVNVPAEGDFTVDDAVAITMSSGAAINGNVIFSNLSAFTQNSGTSINANGKGCVGTSNYTNIPNGSNVCGTLVGTY